MKSRKEPRESCFNAPSSQRHSLRVLRAMIIPSHDIRDSRRRVAVRARCRHRDRLADIPFPAPTRSASAATTVTLDKYGLPSTFLRLASAIFNTRYSIRLISKSLRSFYLSLSLVVSPFTRREPASSSSSSSSSSFSRLLPRRQKVDRVNAREAK